MPVKTLFDTAARTLATTPGVKDHWDKPKNPNEEVNTLLWRIWQDVQANAPESLKPVIREIEESVLPESDYISLLNGRKYAEMDPAKIFQRELKERVNRLFTTLGKRLNNNEKLGIETALDLSLPAARLNHALVELWKEVSKLLPNPPTLNTPGEIRAWFNNPANAASLNGITSLDLAGRKIAIIPPEISKLSGLRSLNLSTNQISDLSPLTALTQLNDLYLDNNQISDLSPLGSLTEINELYLEQNQISDLRPLGSLTRLQRLSLAQNQISDLSPLTALTQLPNLYLEQNQISDLGPLGSLTRLQILYLGQNQISDLGPLGSLTRLQILYLGQNQISDLGPLGSLTRLRILYLERNQITDLIPLRVLTQLESLYLERNQITDLIPLRGLTNVSDLTLAGNPLFFIYERTPEYMTASNNLFLLCDQQYSFNSYNYSSDYSEFVHLFSKTEIYPAEIKTAFFKLDEGDRNLIYGMVFQVSPAANKGWKWGEIHAFDDMIVLRIAVRKAIAEKFERLSEEEKNKVYGHIYALAGRPATHDSQWGKHNAFENVLRLIDAMELLKATPSTSINK